MNRTVALRIIAGSALAVALLAVLAWQLFLPTDSNAQRPADQNPKKPSPASSDTATATPSSASSDIPTTSPTPMPTPTPETSKTPVPKPSVTKTATSHPTHTQTTEPAASAPEPNEDSDPEDVPRDGSSASAVPTADRSSGSSTQLPGPISFTPVDLDEVCNRASSFTLTWTASNNAEGYEVSLFGASISASHRGPGTSMQVACPRVAGEVQVQGYAYSGSTQSEYSYLTLTYSPPMDAQGSSTPFMVEEPTPTP